MKTLTIDVGEIRKLPGESPTGNTLYAVIFAKPLEMGKYIILNGSEMDSLLLEPDPNGSVESDLDPNISFLSDLNAELSSSGELELGVPEKNRDEEIEQWKRDTERAKRAREERLRKEYEDIPVLSPAEQELAQLKAKLAALESKKESEPAEPGILGSLPDVSEEASSDDRLSNIVRTGDNVKGNPYNVDNEEVKRMVRYLVHPHSESDPKARIIEAKKRSIMRVFYGMTARKLASVQDFMPKELRVAIATVKMQGLGQDPVTAAGSNYVPPTWSAFIEGSRQGDEVYNVVSGSFRFETPRLKNEEPGAQGTGEVAHRMPVLARDLQANFQSWLGDNKI